MTVLVTGGAGYIGSHITYALADRGERVVVLDNLETGFRELVSPQATFVFGDVGDDAIVAKIFAEYAIEEVIHLAGSTVVPESVTDPLRYYASNTTCSRNLIDACVRESVSRFICSSTAAVYGEPDETTVTELTPTAPVSPYGRSKLMTDWILKDAARAYPNFNCVTLRYFNVAGADPAGRTGVRDYIHVTDLVSAHLAVLDDMRSGKGSDVYNCGYGHGTSVLEIVAAVEAITGQKNASLTTRGVLATSQC